MRHFFFGNKDQSTLEVAILIKDQAFKKGEIKKHYVDKMVSMGFKAENIVAYSLAYLTPKKAPAQLRKDHLSQVLKACSFQGIKTLLVADGEYFKTLTKEKKADPFIGTVKECKIDGYSDTKVILSLNYAALFYAPEKVSKIDIALTALKEHFFGLSVSLGAGIIHTAEYPKTDKEVREKLESLKKYPKIVCDIEGFGLSLKDCGVGTIGFAVDRHNGFAFSMYEPNKEGFITPDCKQIIDPETILNFFKEYQGTVIYHNAPFDIKQMIFNFCMKRKFSNYKKTLEGLDIYTKKFEDTKIIAYLATNSAQGNTLGLKDLSFEFTGNYAEDVKDITLIPLERLLKYNIIDCLATWFVYDTYKPKMIKDGQEEIYKELMLPSQVDITNMELVGLPLDLDKVSKAKTFLSDIRTKHTESANSNPIVQKWLWEKTAMFLHSENMRLKKKIKSWNECIQEFNPGSNKQLQSLLFDYLGLEVIDLTETKQPATGAKTLEKLLAHIPAKPSLHDQIIKTLLEDLIKVSEVANLLDTFINAFETKSIIDESGQAWIQGNFNLGGTVSGRLSSSGPNLQNMPSSGSTYSKLIKACFKMNSTDWLYCGADFASLEDRISALTTKDTNKLKVYTDGYDGHCLRAQSYFGDLMPDIDPTSVASINSIKSKYEHLRSRSKSPTFLLTYGGSWMGMVKTLGFKEKEAKAIEKNYHKLYVESDKWVETKLDQAAKDGYTEVAFGLRLRTPLLKQVIWGSSTVPPVAKKEGRTVGNAFGQSYCLLNNRASIEFMRKVRASKFKYDIKPCAHIHDASYYAVKNSPEVIHFVNTHLVEAMQWQDLPELQHPTVKLGGELGIFYPDWSKEKVIKNGASLKSIEDFLTTLNESSP